MIVITSITLSSCLEGSNPTKRRGLGSEYPPPHEGYVPKEDLVACLGNACAKAETGLRLAKEGKFDDGLFLAKQARNSLMNKRGNHFFNSRKDYLNDRSKIEYIITEIEEMKKAAAEKKKKEREEKEKLDRELDEKKKSQESFLDDANEELNRLNFGNNNENKFDDIKDPNDYIFQSPQTPSTPDTPSMPETFSYPDTPSMPETFSYPDTPSMPDTFSYPETYDYGS